MKSQYGPWILVNSWQRQGKEVTGTLLELFADCGAILDEEQQGRLAQIQAERKAATEGSG